MKEQLYSMALSSQNNEALILLPGFGIKNAVSPLANPGFFLSGAEKIGDLGDAFLPPLDRGQIP